MTKTIKGIDVSNWQGKSFDWEAEHARGVDFALIKATEGTTFTDPDFHRNWTVSKARGIARGAYHFLHVDQDLETQLAHFLKVITEAALEPGDLVAVDYELTGGLDAGTAASRADRFCAGVKNAIGGVSVIVYTTRGMAGDGYCQGLGDRPLWLAAPGETTAEAVPPLPWHLLSIVQTGQRGVDQDEGFFESADQLRKLGVPAPTVDPTHAAAELSEPATATTTESSTGSAAAAPPAAAPAAGSAAATSVTPPTAPATLSGPDHLGKAEQLLAKAEQIGADDFEAYLPPVSQGILHALLGIGKGMGFL